MVCPKFADKTCINAQVKSDTDPRIKSCIGCAETKCPICGKEACYMLGYCINSNNISVESPAPALFSLLNRLNNKL